MFPFSRRWLKYAAPALMLLAAVLSVFWYTLGNGIASAGRVAGSTKLPPLPVAGPQSMKPLTAEEAKTENDQLPFAERPLEVARSFALEQKVADPLAYRTALDCLTAAVYYEAAVEKDQGQRAVAQVVLNRVRHPAFPSGVCAVVYQGSERTTGCQFSFTCDGSLSRQPSRSGWDRARQIAAGALTGAIEPSVGMATHYHADFVVPYWASSLDKIAAIGAHIFYVWKGGWGRRSSFAQRYTGETAIEASGIVPELPTMPPTEAVSLALPDSPLVADSVNSPLKSLDAGKPQEDAAAGRLLADETAGRLAVDRDVDSRVERSAAE